MLHNDSVYACPRERKRAMVLLDWPPPDHLGIGRKSRQFLPAQASCRDPGTGPRAAPPTVAAQTRIVSKARIRLDSRKSVRSFKGIICVDISEFESYMPSHAVGSLWRVYPVHGLCLGRSHSRTPRQSAGSSIRPVLLACLQPIIPRPCRRTRAGASEIDILGH